MSTQTSLPKEKKTVHKKRVNITHKDSTIFAYLTMAIVSFVMRIIRINYTDNGYPVFDEKHYVSQAHDMLYNGGLENNPGYGLVVHPPLGKYLLSVGIDVFGYTPLGWRIVSILAGITVVLCTMLIIQRITKSLSIAVLAGILINIEGVVFVMSRMGMLDSFLAAGVSLIAACLVMEYTKDRTNTPFHQHWWLLTAGILCGLTMSIKISGVYYAAFAGVFMVLFYAIKSKSAKTTLRSFGVGLVYFFILPVATFLMTYVPWFASENSVYRHTIESTTDTQDFPQWLAWMPESFQNFFYYQLGVLKFHSGLHTDPTSLHPWESHSWQWSIGERPMVFYSSVNADNKLENIWLLGNLSIWWLFIPVIALSIIRLCMKDWKWIIVLGGFTTGYLPWLIMHERQSYFFYVTPLAMFLVTGIVFAIYDISSVVKKRSGLQFNKVFWSISTPYAAAVTIFFTIYTPWYYGIGISEEHHDTLTLFSSWEPLESISIEQTVNQQE